MAPVVNDAFTDFADKGSFAGCALEPLPEQQIMPLRARTESTLRYCSNAIKGHLRDERLVDAAEGLTGFLDLDQAVVKSVVEHGGELADRVTRAVSPSEPAAEHLFSQALEVVATRSVELERLSH